MSLPAKSRSIERLWLVMAGDARMNSRLRDLYEIGFIQRSYDPTGDISQPKRVDFEGSCYDVGLMVGRAFYNIDDYLLMFHLVAQLVVITYDIASKDSIMNLEMLYSKIPSPPDGKIHFRDASPEMVVPMDYFPKILIGCRHPADSIREVEKEDIEKFIADHPGCTFVGECEPDDISIQTVDKVIQATIEVYHSFRKQAQELEPKPVPIVHMVVSNGVGAKKPASEMRKKKCLLM